MLLEDLRQLIVLERDGDLRLILPAILQLARDLAVGVDGGGGDLVALDLGQEPL